MKATMVLTTIQVPTLLEGYAINLEKYDHYDVGFIVIGDNHTPSLETRKLIKNIGNRGFDAKYTDVQDQKEWLKNFPGLEEIIPYNSDNRRNIGYLMAVENGAEIIISLDDDNFVGSEDYFGQHSIVGQNQSLPMVHSSNRWFNPCSILQTEPPRRIYSRGFPYSKRWKDEAKFYKGSGRVVLNLGLWLNNPDVDAVTNLNEPVKITGINLERVMLSPDTYAPSNTQNTAYHRDILPCCYYIRMGFPLEGLKIDRYGDVWQGYFAEKLIHRVGDRVTIGKPLTVHRRNLHDLFKDLTAELYGMIITERLVNSLESCDISAKNYADGYLELAEYLSKAHLGDERGLMKYLRAIVRAMRIWIEVCEKIM